MVQMNHITVNKIDTYLCGLDIENVLGPTKAFLLVPSSGKSRRRRTNGGVGHGSAEAGGGAAHGATASRGASGRPGTGPRGALRYDHVTRYFGGVGDLDARSRFLAHDHVGKHELVILLAKYAAVFHRRLALEMQLLLHVHSEILANALLLEHGGSVWKKRKTSITLYIFIKTQVERQRAPWHFKMV